MKAFGAAFGNKPLPMHYYLGLDERVNPLDEISIDGFTFYQACAKGKHDVAVAFLLSGFDINATEIGGCNNYGYTGLHYASANGDLTLVHILCDQGAKADVPSVNGGVTPLMLALAAGQYDVVRTLITHGADPKRKDASGEPAIFYGAHHPVALHVVKSMLNLDFTAIRNEAGESLLHAAARRADGRNAVLYLVELGGLNVNEAAESTGETPLHHAARVNDIDLIKALLSKGADPHAMSKGGATPIATKGCKHAALMLKVSKEANPAARERLTRPDVSNWARLNMTQLKHFSFFFTVPNIVLYLGAMLPAYIGMFALLGSAIGFTLVAQFALKQKGRSLATAGWFSGALTFGSYVLVSNVFPVLERHDPNGHAITTLWWIVTLGMYASYARAVLGDPGAVQSNQESRSTIIQAVAREGEAAVKREHYDMTTLVRKPLRSKHCSKTHYTVCRFDHYCVWTGNAIGGGNHRPFVHYCMLQTVSQILVAYSTFSVLFTYLPLEAKVDLAGPLSYWNWMLTPPTNTLISYFLVFYNSFVILFVSTVVLTQFWYAMRNVTSNEVWFADRYSWMFLLGSRAYSMYDQGAWKNLVEFFWNGNLVAENYTVPKMNEVLVTKTRQYAASVRSRQQGMLGAAEAPSAIGSGGMDAAASPAGSVESAASWTSTQDANEPGSPQTPAEALTEMQMLLPADKQTEMRTLQDMLQQMIGGATEPVPPPTVTDEAVRAQMVKKVKTMHKHYQMAMRQSAAASTSSPTSTVTARVRTD